MLTKINADSRSTLKRLLRLMPRSMFFLGFSTSSPDHTPGFFYAIGGSCEMYAPLHAGVKWLRQSLEARRKWSNRHPSSMLHSHAITWEALKRKTLKRQGACGVKVGLCPQLGGSTMGLSATPPVSSTKCGRASASPTSLGAHRDHPAALLAHLIENVLLTCVQPHLEE